MIIHFDMDGKKIEVDGDFCFYPNPHGACHRINEKGVPGIFACEFCESTDWLSSCTHEWEPCRHCGLRGICASDCGGVIGILSDPSVYVATGDHDEPIQ